MNKKTYLFIIGIVILIVGFIFLARANNPVIDDIDLTKPLLFREFKNKIENKDSFILVIVDSRCPICEQFKPTLNSVIEEYNLEIYSINTMTFNEEERAYLNSIAHHSGTPTTIFIKDGIEETTLNRIVGKVSQSDLVNRLRALNYIE